MSPNVILWPMIAHVALVYVVYVALWNRRVAAVRAGDIKAGQFRMRGQDTSLSVTAANNVMNQFELPMLFHAGCLALYASGGVGAVPLALAWAFIASRYAHAWVHLTSNRLRWPATLFQVGFGLNGLLWAWLALHLLALV